MSCRAVWRRREMCSWLPCREGWGSDGDFICFSECPCTLHNLSFLFWKPFLTLLWYQESSSSAVPLVRTLICMFVHMPTTSLGCTSLRAGAAALGALSLCHSPPPNPWEVLSGPLWTDGHFDITCWLFHDAEGAVVWAVCDEGWMVCGSLS